jgi:hypothetical protein
MNQSQHSFISSPPTIHIASNTEIAYSILRSFKNGSIKLILNNQQAFFSEPVEITSRIASPWPEKPRLPIRIRCHLPIQPNCQRSVSHPTFCRLRGGVILSALNFGVNRIFDFFSHSLFDFRLNLALRHQTRQQPPFQTNHRLATAFRLSRSRERESSRFLSRPQGLFSNFF